MRVGGAEYLLVESSLLRKAKISEFECDVITYERSAICDIKIRAYSHDGTELAFCANAVCCAIKFFRDKGIITDNYATVETSIGIFEAKCFGNSEIIELNLGRVRLKSKDDSQKLIRFYPINLDGDIFDITVVCLGIPHVVVFLGESVDNFDIINFAKHFENNSIFSTESEISFVYRIDSEHLKVRSVYRGRELQNCGSAACAVAVAAGICGIVDFDTYIKAEFPRGEVLALCNRDIEAFLKCSPVYVKEF